MVYMVIRPTSNHVPGDKANPSMPVPEQLYGVRTKRLYVHATKTQSSCATCPCVLILSPVMMCFWRHNEPIFKPAKCFREQLNPIARFPTSIPTTGVFHLVLLLMEEEPHLQFLEQQRKCMSTVSFYENKLYEVCFTYFHLP